MSRTIPGTVLFDGRMAARGRAINRMCFDFNRADRREAFLADPAGHCRACGLSDDEVALVTAGDVLGLIDAGASIYYLAKLAGILGWDVQDVGAAQTGMTKAEFQAMLDAAAVDLASGHADLTTKAGA